ncbi:hypothetical protein [uncultured Psychroserpens sp.]|uniref:hypothetical protein n=1 Tax=uncultured Psychroserpens sp. TaxID=255436 RepID=UPI002620CE00|nr:hypothetical protein [uncultured Psychroserpens sp.]
MAPIKFEDKLKERLEKRNLQPTPTAWDQLSNRLDTHERSSNKMYFWWLGIAASFIGILFISIQFFGNSDIEKDSQHIVNTELYNETSNEIITESNVKETIEESNSNEMNSHKPFKTIIKSPTTVAERIESVETKSNPTHNQKIILNQNQVIASTNEMEKATAITLSPEDTKVLEVVTQINKLQANGNVVTDEEIDMLLKQAEKEILKQRLHNKATRTVDANVLLQDVEADLDQSFRTKVFEALKASYGTVKTAVAERNN